MGIHSQPGGKTSATRELPAKPSAESEAESQRAAIVAAAALAFSRRGFAATKIDDVAEVLNSTKGLIYYHFKSKGDLFLAVHHDALSMDLAQLSPIAAAEAPPDRKLFDLLFAHAKLITDHNPIHRVVVQGVELHLAGATTPPQRTMLKKIVTLRDRYEQLFLDVILKGIEQGCLRAEDPGLAVKAVLGAVSWMTMWYKPSLAKSEKETSELARKMCEVAIGGILLPSQRDRVHR